MAKLKKKIVTLVGIPLVKIVQLVGLEYPSQLHELHNDYPLAPEKLEISQNMLSNIVLILQMNME